MVVGGVPLHPTASLFTAYRFQPLKKALYSDKEPFLHRMRRIAGESTP